MKQTTMQALLAKDEERVRRTLQAGQSVDKSRESAVNTLGDELGALLLRYNAAYVDDPERQAAADAMTAAAREQLALLRAGRTELKSARRETRAGAPWLLLLAAALSALSVWLLREGPALYAAAGFALALLCAYLSGRLWTKAGAPEAETTLDPELLWQTLQRTAETMDRKLEDFAALAQARRAEERAEKEERPPLTPEELALMGELLEALYTESGDFALRQLRRLRPYLREKGIETVDYSAETAELFELMPSKNAAATLRPALLHGKKLLMTGRAAVPQD